MSESSSRSLKSDDSNKIICSPYTDVHVVNFSYTVDTKSSDEADIRDAIKELESRSLLWLAGNLLPCNGRRLGMGSSFAETSHERRELRPDLYNELGIVGLKSWPDDILSSSSNCFPTNNKNDTCTVVFGTVSAYLHPASTGTISETQKAAVENNIRYQMMTFMRSGLLENNIESIEYARYLSPIVAINDNKIRVDTSSQPLHFTEKNDDSGMAVTLSILIIAACFTIIGAIGLILTMKVLFRQEEDFSSVKQQHTADDDESMIPQTSGWGEHTLKEHGYIWGKMDESGNFVDGNSDQHSMGESNVIQTQSSNQAAAITAGTESDWGTNANLSATMRRMKVAKKVPIVRARSGDMINLGSVMEEDDEETPSAMIK